jgi:hypothetical protein
VDPQRYLTELLLDDPLFRRVLERLAALSLPDSWLVAGSVTAAVWNRQAGLPLTHGIKDLDLVYFDPQDVSVETERRLEAALSDLPLPTDVKNQARVPLWYAAKFGRPCPDFTCSAEAIATYPTLASCIGVSLQADEIALCAPYGCGDLLAGVVRPNYRLVTQAVYEAKTSRWRQVWPHLTIEPWLEQEAASG